MHAALALRNTQLNATRASYNSGKVRFYDGARPVDANTALAGSNHLLAELTLAATAFPSTSTGQLVANAITAGTVAISGTASFVRITQSDGTTVLHDMSVGTTSASEVVVSSLVFVAGQPVGISALLINQFPVVLPPPAPNVVLPLGGPGGYSNIVINDMFGNSRTDAVGANNITSVSQFNPSTPYGLAGSGWDTFSKAYGSPTPRASVTMQSDHLEITPTNNASAPSWLTSHFEVPTPPTLSYYYEIRCKTGRGPVSGTWPAIWFYAGNDPGFNDQQSEMDVMETYTDQQFGSVAVGGLYTQYFVSTQHGLPNHASYGQRAVITTGNDITVNYNLFGVELFKVGGLTGFRMYFNGTLVVSDFAAGMAWQSSPPALLLGWNPGSSPNTPAVFWLDYVRVWSK